MDLFQNGKSLGNAISEDDLVAMMDSQTGDRGYAKVSDLVTGGMTTLTPAQAAAVRAGLGLAKSVKDFGAVGDGVADDTTALGLALAWVFEESNRSLDFDSGQYVLSSRISVSSADLVRKVAIFGKGATISASSGAGVDISVTGTGSISDIDISGIRFTGGSDSLTFTADASTRYIYNVKLSSLSFEGYTGSGLVLSGNVFEIVIDHCSGTADAGNSTGYGIYLLNNGTGIISSVDIIGGTWRGGKNGLYAKSPVQDLNLFGGTYLFAKEEGVVIESALGVGIYSPHVEGNWSGAADIASGGAGLRVSGSGVVIGVKGYCSASQKQKYVLKAYATASGLIIQGGAKQGSTVKFGQYQQATGGELILVGTVTQDYDAVGELFPTFIGTKNYAKQQGLMENFLSFATTRTPDLSKGSYVRIGALTDNITIANPTGYTARTGDTLAIEVLQDGTGGRTVTWGSVFSASLQAVDAGANKRTIWNLVYRAGKWGQLSCHSSAD